MVKSIQISTAKTTQKDSPCFCLAAIVLVSVCKMKTEDDKYYSQIYLEESWYEQKKWKKKKRHIIEKIVIPINDEIDESLHHFKKLSTEYFCTTKHKRDVSRLPQKLLVCFFLYCTFSRHTCMHPHGNFMDHPTGTMCLDDMNALCDMGALW